MTGLLFNIQNAGNQYENVTSDVLAEILNGIPACKKAFLNLFEPSVPMSDNPIEREVEDDQKGRVDFRYRSNDCVVLIENKPWEPESTVNGQLSEYAKAMRSLSEGRKYLCLLSVEANRERLLNEIAHVESVSVSALADTFREKYNVVFVERTWQQVFSALETVQPENEALTLWIKTLKDYFPKEIKLTKADQETFDNITDNWDGKIVPIVQNLIRQFSDKAKFDGYVKDGLSYATGQYKGEFYGNYFNDPQTNMVYWVGAHKSVWKKCRDKSEKHYLFVIAIGEYNFKLYNRPIPITLDELRKAGFETVEKNNSYAFPLIDLVDVSHAQISEMTEKAIKAMNAVRDLIKLSVK